MSLARRPARRDFAIASCTPRKRHVLFSWGGRRAGVVGRCRGETGSRRRLAATRRFRGESRRRRGPRREDSETSRDAAAGASRRFRGHRSRRRRGRVAEIPRTWVAAMPRQRRGETLEVRESPPPGPRRVRGRVATRVVDAARAESEDFIGRAWRTVPFVRKGPESGRSSGSLPALGLRRLRALTGGCPAVAEAAANAARAHRTYLERHLAKTGCRNARPRRRRRRRRRARASRCLAVTTPRPWCSTRRGSSRPARAAPTRSRCSVVFKRRASRPPPRGRFDGSSL